MTNQSLNKYTDDEMLLMLKVLAGNRLERPHQRTITYDKYCPSGRTYVYRFGSIAEAIRKAGLDKMEHYGSEMTMCVEKYLNSVYDDVVAGCYINNVKYHFYVPSENMYIDIEPLYNNKEVSQEMAKFRYTNLIASKDNAKYYIVPALLDGYMGSVIKSSEIMEEK